MAPGSVSGGCKGIHRCGRYPVFSIYLLRRTRGNLLFDPPKLGDHPPTGELIAPLYHSLLLLQSPSLRRQLWPTGRRSPSSSIIVLWTALYQARGGGLSTVSCARFYVAGRRRLSTVSLVRLYIVERRGRLSTVPFVRFYIAVGWGRLSTVLCVRFYIAEGGTALYRPLCSVLHSGEEGTALYRPLCSVFYSN